MNEKLIGIVDQIQKLQGELDREIAKRRKDLGYSLSGHLVEFEKAAAEGHRALRIGVLKYLREAGILAVLTAPVIYAVVVPILILDVSVTLYQHICFRAYRIPRVRRADYMIFDRQHLRYLNWIEALNCLYCSYANGVIAYAREIAGRTEKYWCPIKHAFRAQDPHQHYFEFLDYGDADGYRARLADFRARLAEAGSKDGGAS